MFIMDDSTYTVQLQTVCKFLIVENTDKTIEEVQALGVSEIAKLSAPFLFNFPYPIFQESYRPTLQENFIKYYYTNEIGSETPHLFMARLMSDMQLKMPIYNKLYESSLLEFDILNNIDIKESATKTVSSNRNGTGTNEANTTSGTNNSSVYSDTPQGLLSGKDYATSLTKQDNMVTSSQKGNTSSNDTTEGTETNTFSRLGNDGSTTSAIMLQQYRDILINIDQMLFNDLSDLFMLLLS